MSASGFLFGVALVIIICVKALSDFIITDPCEGDGTWRAPIRSDTDDGDDIEDEKQKNAN